MKVKQTSFEKDSFLVTLSEDSKVPLGVMTSFFG